MLASAFMYFLINSQTKTHLTHFEESLKTLSNQGKQHKENTNVFGVEVTLT